MHVLACMHGWMDGCMHACMHGFSYIHNHTCLSIEEVDIGGGIPSDNILTLAQARISARDFAEWID